MTKYSKLVTTIDPRTMCASAPNAVGYTRLPIDRVIIHHNATTNKNVALSTWLTTGSAQTSAHYEITPTEIIGCVEEAYSAWHAGDSTMNRRSIGIEHVNSTGAPNWEVAEATLKNSAKLCADICKRYGIPIDSKHILPHKAVTATSCPGGIDMTHYISLVKAAAGQKVTASTTSKPATGSKTSTKAVTVTYELHQQGGSWLGTVTNFNNSDSNGFAGNPNHKHDLLWVKASRGKLKYRVHTLGGGWLPWVSKGDKSDLVNGVAGTKGKVIDGVQIIFLTPKGEPYQQAFYRSQTTQRAGYLATCCDDGKSIKGFGAWAGMYGEPMDRLQIKIGNVAPF